MEIWVVFTLAAAAMQTLRFMLQKILQGAGLSTAGATFARFLFAAPIACVIAAATFAVTGQEIPSLSARFWAFVLLGGAAQIVATFLTVALFALRNFAVGVAFTKTETVQVALFSALVLAEPVTGFGWFAISVGLVGVLFLSRSPAAGARFLGRPALYGVLAGALFGISAVGYRGATLELLPLDFFSRAIVALAAATVAQSIAMSAWLAWREPGELGRVLTRWRRTVLVGVTGVSGSLGWFAAFSLQNAAYVRAVGQVEIVFTLLASAFVFRERLRLREALGIALVIASLLLIVFAIG
ncbi:DMT family transporter [Defluviimonas sp. WL0002]|uniref:DMT family transporter n=1 Tax=Albidovulum marisflavi TaxID=2984159 RepID=A0ABT2ZCC4_9RHOB|nr:DMT family transporter [Defluviimonas sp. WL0002]MCV2868798.1 DMT family transporter [Defluviimonas sp. WL0002]